MSTRPFDPSAARNNPPPAESLATVFDYIVCGAGTSGCVTAARLAENPNLRVLLIEAGGSDESDVIVNPNRWPQTLGTDLDWQFITEANPRLEGRSIPYAMGKVLGGGSSINVSTWSRGHQADWDHYAEQAGDDAWNYPHVLDLYRRKIERWSGSPNQVHRGEHGKVHVQPAASPHPFALAVLKAAESAGLPRFANANGQMMEAPAGCALVDETILDGQRQSIYRSYVHPLLAQENLTVITGATVTRLLFEKLQATGVQCRYQGHTLSLRASREVVLSLGAVNTPKLLMQSGIGNETELKALDIPVILDLPGVGRNLHDHVAFGCVWATDDETLPPIPRSQTACFWKSDANLDSPNFYTYARRGPAITPENAEHFPMPANCWSLMVGMRPKSRGSVHLTGRDADAPMRIDTGYLRDPGDLDDLVAGVAMAREIGNAEALRPYRTREIAPGPLGREALALFLRRGLGTFWHQSGTARMGRDAQSVVDGRLRVHGVEGLRIADASIMPRVTSGNTMAPCVVIGELAASFLLQSAQ
jgi:choline dehydrogenase